MHRLRQTKIVATLGPSSSSPEMIEHLFLKGVDVFRLNFSHGDHEQHAQVYAAIRAIEERLNRPIGVLIDLQGPKLRIGRFTDGAVMLETGQSFRLDLAEDALGDQQRVALPHPEIFATLEPDKELLVDDGKIRLHVEKCGADFAETRVLAGGALSNHKGVNLPGVLLPLSALTAKDHADLAFGLELGGDIIGLSFVQRPQDILDARAIIGKRARIAAKIEKPSAIDALEEIIELSDAIMIARGDLGVEMPPEEVPPLQRRIIRLSRQAGKPVIVATQMLESMIHAPTPTRAETSDVANAVYAGADAVMLSAESASGDFPLETVTIMDRIIQRAESDPLYHKDIEIFAPASHPATIAEAIATAARQVAEVISARAVVTFTTQGATTLCIARQRPNAPLIALTAQAETARFLSLVWGVQAVVIQEDIDFSHMDEKACAVALQSGCASVGQSIVVTAGLAYEISHQANILTPGTTNTLRILNIGLPKA